VNPDPGAVAVEYQTKVKLFIKDAPSEWISGAIVCLYDRDLISRDDHLGTDITNQYGEATFRFTADQFIDIDDRIGGALPDLFVEVYDADGKRVLSTRAAAERNAVPELIRIPVARELARRHRLI
jgi:hypothetical protein